MYRVRTYPEARDVIASLPEIALAGYAEALGVMKLVPWSGESINKANPGGEVRQLVFAPEGRGMVTYLERYSEVIDLAVPGRLPAM